MSNAKIYTLVASVVLLLFFLVLIGTCHTGNDPQKHDTMEQQTGVELEADEAPESNQATQPPGANTGSGR